MNRKIVILYGVFVVLSLSILLMGCAHRTTTEKDENKIIYTVNDCRGKVLKFTKKPQKIVCTYVFADEILLGVVDHKRIAGLDKWIHDENLSSAVTEAADVSTIVENNTESIVKIHPDLVLLPSYVKPEMIRTLEEIGLKVFIYRDAKRLHEIPNMIFAIANAVGEPEKGQDLINKLNKDLEVVRKIKSPQNLREKVLMFMRFGAFGGKGTIYNDVITMLGFYDCYNDVRKKATVGQNLRGILSKEEVVKANPDLFLMALWTQGGAYKDSEAQLQEIYNDPAYATVNAVKNKRAYIFPQRYVNCLSHHAGSNMIQLAKILEDKERQQGSIGK